MSAAIEQLISELSKRYPDRVFDTIDVMDAMERDKAFAETVMTAIPAVKPMKNKYVTRFRYLSVRKAMRKLDGKGLCAWRSGDGWLFRIDGA